MQRHMIVIPAALALVLFPSSAGADVLEAEAGGFVVENTEVVPVTPEAAWDALVTKVDAWWPRDHTWFGKESTLSIDPVAGGCFCEMAGKRQARHMTVVFVDPPRLLRMEGGLGPFQKMGMSGALEWRIKATDDGTRITLRYQIGGYSTTDLSRFAPVVDAVQAQQLGGLAEYLRPEATGEN